MIVKAKATSYGINDLRYFTGESKHKKHPEKYIGYWTICYLQNWTLWEYGTHAFGPFPTSADKEFHYQNSVESIA